MIPHIITWVGIIGLMYIIISIFWKLFQPFTIAPIWVEVGSLIGNLAGFCYLMYRMWQMFKADL